MYCPNCGKALREIAQLTKYWVTFYKCPTGPCSDYLSVDDPHDVYPPLLQMDRRVIRALDAAPEAALEAAFAKIRRIDHKTVSIVAFEDAMVAAYNDQR